MARFLNENSTLKFSGVTSSTLGISDSVRNEIVVNIVIAVGLIALFLALPLVLMYCRKSCARRKVKKFQRKRKLRHHQPCDVTSYQLAAGQSPEVKLDNYDVISRDCSTREAGSRGGIVTSSSHNNESNSGIFLENFAYGDRISSPIAGNSNHSDEPRKPSREDNKYENIERTAGKRRRCHAYETIVCEGNAVKIIENNLPVPIQIKSQSTSEDVTIFPHVSNKNKELMSPPHSTNKNKELTNCQVFHKQKVANVELNVIGSHDNKAGQPTESKIVVTSPQTSRIKPNSNQTASSPYAVQTTPLRNKHHPNLSFLRTSAVLQTHNTSSPYLERAWSAPNRNQTWEEVLDDQADHQLKKEVNNRKTNGDLGNLEHGKILQKNFVPIKNIRTNRNHRRRMKRKKRRVLDARRARITKNNHNDKTNQSTIDLKSRDRNPWPLNKMFYFGTSTDSSGDFFNFRSHVARKNATGSTNREASLLEDIWFHLDEIASKSQRKKESVSEYHGSVSLSSSSENLQLKQKASRETMADRGYFTYKEQDFDRQMALEVWQECEIMPRDSHPERVSGTRKFADQTEWSTRFPAIRPAVPNLTRSKLRPDVISDVIMSVTDGTSYLDVLDCYFASESIYGKLSDFVTLSQNKIEENSNDVDDGEHGSGEERFVDSDDVTMAATCHDSRLSVVEKPTISFPRLNFDAQHYVTAQNTSRGLCNKSVVSGGNTRNYVVVLPSMLLRKNKQTHKENLSGTKIAALSPSCDCESKVISPPDDDIEERNLSLFMEMEV